MDIHATHGHSMDGRALCGPNVQPTASPVMWGQVTCKTCVAAIQRTLKIYVVTVRPMWQAHPVAMPVLAINVAELIGPTKAGAKMLHGAN